MMKKGITEPFTIDEISFRKCFSTPSLEIFVAMVTGWTLTVGRHTISSVILTMRLHESRHFASVYRFVSRGRWLADMVSHALFQLMLDILVPRGAEILLVVDDTLNKHRGKRITGAGWQHDGSAFGNKKRKGYGVCFVIIGLAVRLDGIAERVFCLPYAARLWWPPRAKVKPKGMPYKTKPELAVELMRLTRSWIDDDRVIRVIVDKGFTCNAVINGRPPWYGDNWDNSHGICVVRTSRAMHRPVPREAPQEGSPNAVLGHLLQGPNRQVGRDDLGFGAKKEGPKGSMHSQPSGTTQWVTNLCASC